MGASKNSDLSWQAYAPAKPAYMPSMAIRARKYRTDDCMDAGGRAKQDARAENRNV